MSLDSNLQSFATAVGTAVKARISASEKGALSGVATLDATGKVPSSQLNIIDNLTSTSSSAALSANQGKVLKGLLDGINTLLSSNDTSLDQLQEIVDFVKANKSIIDGLGISNISGLQTALDAKATTSALSTLSANVGATDTNYVTVFNAALV